MCLQDKEWDILDSTKSKIDHFKHLIPLIVDMRNPAMRERYHHRPEHGLLSFLKRSVDWHNVVCSSGTSASPSSGAGCHFHQSAS